ncbi:uncharacterized protein BJ212DRAFT_1271715 [Suillus subaureus]|uniref:MYND-type domain-containing protein n=1 Tax=Suillus subaureus TaxID=48587 RepID=A0A9P7EB17_9AGAM|nr:uncharacterized protein BJ212DRAFT_1271715 [Suillus subaureus]KAG1816482.1 hypothetical protein BJ212DRAFT_1271715 [Suillus subaureus]
MPKSKKHQSLLRNSFNFPTFSGLPDEPENEIDLRYYDNGPFGFKPGQHWCFLGEIVESIGLVRVLLRVKDKDGQVVTVGLYTDDRGQALAPQIKEGHTVAVLYGEQHGFLDMSVGIRVEDTSNIKIIPCSLEQLLKASDDVATLRKGQPRRCGSCGKEENASDNTHLRLCSRCRHTPYCGEDCQKKAWAAGHKANCKALVGVRWFTERNWRTFHDWFNF